MGLSSLISINIYRILSKLRTFSKYRRIDAIRCISFLGKGVVINHSAQIVNLQRDPQKLTIGNNSHIDGIIQVFPYGDGIHIGDNCYLGVNSRIWAADKVVIGSNVLISHNVNIIDTDSHEIDYKQREISAKKQLIEGIPASKGNVKTARIFIKDNAWISYNVCILKGVTIGKGTIIGCGSVVTHDIPDMCLAAGNPAKVIKYLD